MATPPAPVQQLLGDLAPKMVRLTDDVLFGDAWQHEGLSPRERSPITVAVLAATARPGRLDSHLKLALRKRRDQGRTRRGPHPGGFLRGPAQRHGRTRPAQGLSSRPPPSASRPAPAPPGTGTRSVSPCTSPKASLWYRHATAHPRSCRS
ncbi:carboxymuconolactone decarboxylase family protein [Streptomyces sp. NPDC058718]|uniref:carboxymuconolactone decarboxylase family protein n=1 Tax=Streptomyces sp. NPDC058718 TaxID=3346610 RepID=UPI0036A3E5CA